MPTLIKYYGEYSNEDVCESLIHYCLDSEYNKGYYGGTGVFMDSNEILTKQFKDIQTVYNKKKKCLEHFIISFNDSSSKRNSVIDFDVYYIADAISRYIGQRFQNIYSVHSGSGNKNFCIHTLMNGPIVNPENLHVHFIINRVSYIDGTMFYGNKRDYIDILNYAKATIPLLLHEEKFKDLIWYGPIFEETYTRLKI